MKQRMLSVLTAGFFILAGFVGCSDDIGDISPDKSVHYIMKAGKINLDYIPSHIVVTYDELNGDLLYSATPGHILTGAVVTLLDGTSKTTTVTSEYTGTGDVKLIPDSDEGTYYDPAYTGKFDVGKAKQETVELITLKTTTLDVSYAGGLLHVLPQPLAEKIKWNNDPNKLVIDDFGNEILVLDGSVDDDNYYVDWMLYIYSDEYINEELAEDKAAERTASIEAATASQTDVNKALVISDYGDNIPENALINVAEIYDFNGVELFTKDYEKVVIHITSSAYVDKTDLISAILSAITAKTGVFVATAADQVPVGKKWVSTDALNTLQGLITAAETVRNNTDATQEEVKTATDNLTAGINTFNKAIGNGTAIAPADGWLDRSELGNKITEANALKIGYPIISKADTEGEGEAEDVAKVEEGFQYVGKAANEVLAGTISTAEALYAKPDSVLFTEAKALDGNSEKEDTAIKGIVQTNIVAQVDSLKSAMANFEKEVKKGTKNIQNEKTNPLPEGVPTDAGGKEIVFPPPPQTGESSLITPLFNQPYTPVIYTALVSAPNITTTGDTPVDANRNTVVVSSKEINSGNGIYTWQVADAGYYKITLWGAQGGNVVTRAGPTELRIAYGGRGAKTEGIIWLRAGLKLTFYLGGQGRGSYLHHGTDYIAAGFNGGGKGGIGIQSVFPDGAGGGGATDVRIGGKRIMVAAGGGGGAQEADRWYPITPGPGGKETSNDTPTGEGRRAQGIAGVKPLIDGDIKLIKDGTGQSGAKKKSNATIWEGNSGAGGGYYGGYAGQSNNDKVSAATGGTSYISGYNYTDGYESLYKPEYYIFNKDSAKMFSDGDADYATTEGLGNGKFEVILLKKDTDVTAED